MEKSIIKEVAPNIYDWEIRASRYRILLSTFQCKTLVTWLHKDMIGGSSFLIQTPEVGIGYFMEKMSMSDAREKDAISILDFLVHMKIIEEYY